MPKHEPALSTDGSGRRNAETVLYFVRHTDVANPKELFYGRLKGFGLSDLGQTQADRTASVLASEPLAAIYTSPMLRARQTARIIAQPHALRPKVTWLLAEVRSGWQGRPFTDLHEIEFDFYSRPLNPSDESVQDIWERIVRFTADVRALHAGGTVVAVTHGDVCMTARAGFLGLPAEVGSIRLPHVYAGKGSLTQLRFSPELQETYPISVNYFDPNGKLGKWRNDWVMLDRSGAFDG